VDQWIRRDVVVIGAVIVYITYYHDRLFLLYFMCNL